MSRQRGFWRGAIIGAGAGALLALLFAPKSGKETQADLKRRAKLVKRDLAKMIEDLGSELGGRIDELKTAARDLQGEAKEESQELIRRAEVLKTDLRSSASNLTHSSGYVKDAAVADAKRLIDQGSATMTEMERVTRKLLQSVRGRVRSERSGDDEHEENGE